MRDSSKIEQQLEMASRPIAGPMKLEVKTVLQNFPALQSVLHCLDNKIPFGLRGDAMSTAIFDPENLIVYDYTGKDAVKTTCRDEKDFSNYLKLVAIDHRTFLKAETCISYIKLKNEPKKKLITNI